jgi:ribosomal protein S18 acetylase RimI-like enzyme
MISYRFLQESDFALLHHCFLTAFSDYAVDMRISEEQLRQRFIRDGVQLKISAGAFDDNEKMVGFTINAAGSWARCPTIYDSGTGVIPEYRGSGVATALFNFMLPELRAIGAKQYLLEVITSNVAAARLYLKLGFRETRMLSAYKAAQPLAGRAALDTVDIRDVESVDWQLFQTFWDFGPSWQNSIEAVERVGSSKCTVGAHLSGECIGYGIVSRLSTNVMQLAVSQKHRRQGLGSLILAFLQSRVGGELLKVNNIDRRSSGALSFYEANGFTRVLDQFEMMKTL